MPLSSLNEIKIRLVLLPAVAFIAFSIKSTSNVWSFIGGIVDSKSFETSLISAISN
jgi:hypothetical protein